MQKTFLVINLCLILVVSSAWGGTSRYAIKIYEDYTLTNGMSIWVPFIGDYVSEGEFDRFYKSGAGNYSFIEMSIAGHFEEYGITCFRSTLLKNGIRPKYKIVYSFEEGIGLPSLGRQCLLSMTFTDVYRMKMHLISFPANKVVAEVTFRRHRLGSHDSAFVYKMVDMLYTKGAISNSVETKQYPGIAQ